MQSGEQNDSVDRTLFILSLCGLQKSLVMKYSKDFFNSIPQKLYTREGEIVVLRLKSQHCCTSSMIHQP